MGFLRRSPSSSRRTTTSSSGNNSTSTSPTTSTPATSSNSTPTSPIPTVSPMSTHPRTSSRKISKHGRKTRTRTSSTMSTSASPSPSSPNYFQDPHHRRARVTMVPTTFAPVSAYFPRDYQFEFEDEGYDSASSSSSDDSVGSDGLHGSPVAAAGWRPAQGSLEMEFMFGDMDDEFMAELTRESTPADDIVMAEVDNMYHYSSTPSTISTTTAWGLGQDRSMGGRVVDEDYD